MGKSAQAKKQCFRASHEYDCLRHELSESTRFVFERPLVIATIGAALAKNDATKFGVALPTLIVGLLLFNYVFTVNRLLSCARIVGYIQVAFEANHRGSGWETSLHDYRRLYPDSRLSSRKAIGNFTTTGSAPGALMYYKPTYWFHVIVVGACLAIGLSPLLGELSSESAIRAAPLVVLSTWFACLAVPNHPYWACRLVEVNIDRWNHVLSTTPQEDETREKKVGGSMTTAPSSLGENQKASKQ